MSLKFRNQLNSFFPANHAFFIAVQDYENVAPLRTPVNDVKSLAEVLCMDIHDFQVHEALLNPGKQALENFIANTLPAIVGPDDRVLLYFAGHGIAIDEIDQMTPRGFLLPADARKEEEESYVSMTFLNDYIQRLPCRHLLLLLDCCFAGSFQWAAKPFRGFGRHLPKNIYRQRFDFFVKHPAWQVITSAAYHQQALDVVYGHALGQRERGKTSKGANSPFAEALLYALRDGAGDRSPADGLMTVSEIFAYLQDRLAQFSHIHTQKPAFFPLVPNHRQGEFVFLNPKVKLHLSDYRDDDNPYRGLQAYEFENRGTFYGRERVVTNMKQILEGSQEKGDEVGTMEEKADGSPILIISGDSGAGKSSAVKAGLLPELKKQGYHSIIFRPSTRPVEALDTAMKEAEDLKATASLVLIVDQLEELITQYAPETEREAFLSTLAKLIENRDIFQKIILTVRSDFETLFEQSPLAPWWLGARYTMPGFEYEELQEVVLQPMQERCIEYEDGLIEELIREVQNRIGGLPLLSFTLSELYERYIARLVQNDSPRKIMWEDYRAIGGVVGSLQKGADQAYKELPDEHYRNSLQHLMLRLTSLSGGERAGRRALYDELEFEDRKEQSRIAFVRDKWIERRLLRSGKDIHGKKFVEPAHDALVRSWKQMQSWIQKDQEENILLLAKLGNAVGEYYKHKENTDYLWHNNPSFEQLYNMQKKELLLLNLTEIKFLERSRRLKNKNRNVRNTWIISAFIVLISLAIWALDSYFGQIQKGLEAGITGAKIPLTDGKYGIAAQSIKDLLKSTDITSIDWLDTLICKRPEMRNLLGQADSLCGAWMILQDSTEKAKLLIRNGKLREGYYVYKNASNFSPNDSFIVNNLIQIDSTIRVLCKDLKEKGLGFKLYSEPDTAITRFRRFLDLTLKPDKDVEKLLLECEEMVNSKK